MRPIIVVAGGTGNLGERIVTSLVQNGAEVRALVRMECTLSKVKNLENLGATVYPVNMMQTNEVAKVCVGASCVVSALAGLRDVIIDVQKVLLDAAVKAGVPRFIPSDYSLDFTKFSHGENRNLDLRREFHAYLDQQPIAATTVFNGAFADMLTAELPMIFFTKHLVLHWGNAAHRLGFTTVSDTAAFTAKVALETSTPRFLHIAGSQLNPIEIQAIVSELTGEKFRIIRAGGQELLGIIIRIARKFDREEKDLYPAWQGMQYMHNMIDQRATLTKLDNNRYPELHWTTVREMLSNHLSN